MKKNFTGEFNTPIGQFEVKNMGTTVGKAIDTISSRKDKKYETIGRKIDKNTQDITWKI